MKTNKNTHLNIYLKSSPNKLNYKAYNLIKYFLKQIHLAEQKGQEYRFDIAQENNQIREIDMNKANKSNQFEPNFTPRHLFDTKQNNKA